MAGGLSKAEQVVSGLVVGSEAVLVGAGMSCAVLVPVRSRMNVQPDQRY